MTLQMPLYGYYCKNEGPFHVYKDSLGREVEVTFVSFRGPLLVRHRVDSGPYLYKGEVKGVADGKGDLLPGWRGDGVLDFKVKPHEDRPNPIYGYWSPSEPEIGVYKNDTLKKVSVTQISSDPPQVFLARYKDFTYAYMGELLRKF